MKRAFEISDLCGKKLTAKHFLCMYASVDMLYERKGNSRTMRQSKSDCLVEVHRIDARIVSQEEAR